MRIQSYRPHSPFLCILFLEYFDFNLKKKFIGKSKLSGNSRKLHQMALVEMNTIMVSILDPGFSLLLYLSVSLQMLPDGHSLLDEVVEILRQVWGQTLGLQDPQDLVAGNETYLSHTMGVPQNNTYTRRQKQAFNLDTVCCSQTSFMHLSCHLS